MAAKSSVGLTTPMIDLPLHSTNAGHSDSTVASSTAPDSTGRARTRAASIRPPLLVPPAAYAGATTELEYSVHGTNAMMRAELARVFPFEALSDAKRQTRLDNLKVIITFQRCRNDLVGIGPQVDLEKDERLETARSPRGPAYFPDVEAAEIFLDYDALWTGCCKVLTHPRWGASVYPASLFTDAPAADVQQAADEACGYRSRLGEAGTSS
ncbi:hypothetical protein THASP1DRAFT_26068 [Thamnocephalis sphaerospora]|uniref:Uncharacterized protein n=1 Tax=Thamnocephalis sphaerospora TaxID=78915 RepID=A0A4V1IVW1_9FUNG|nr:hypothetical protein THASP1DRAFT_26068 [Thamnocephalis sphaerospora]|eukprot:RKP05439.1 hypothetical protein THASP1DRAFT_26068 [Thamnocephalis sphaerospora]